MPTAAELYAMARAQDEKEQAERRAKIRQQETLLYNQHYARIEEIAKDYKFSKKQIALLHSKAYEDHHSSGYGEVEDEFRELCSLLEDCLKAA